MIKLRQRLRFSVSTLLYFSTVAAVLFQLYRMFPAFWTAWLIVGVWSVLLLRNNLRIMSFQISGMLYFFWMRLGFGDYLGHSMAPYFAEEGAMIGLLLSILILVVNRFENRKRDFTAKKGSGAKNVE